MDCVGPARETPFPGERASCVKQVGKAWLQRDRPFDHDVAGPTLPFLILKGMAKVGNARGRRWETMLDI